MDHRTLHKGGTLRMTIRCYVNEILSTPSSITVTSYLNGSATGDTITPSVDALGTGLSTITYAPSGTAAGDTLTLKISQTVSGTTRVTTVDVMVVDTAATIATGVWNALTSALTTAGSIGKYLLDHIVGTLAAGTHNPQSGDAYARLGAPAGASVSADVAAVLAAVQANGGGSGARSVSITVNDGTSVLTSARVRVSQGSESYVVSTNGSGVAAFNLDDATWTVIVTKPGYTLAAQTLVVDGTETVTYSMTEVSISPPEYPQLATGFGYCYDQGGEPEEDVSIEFELRLGTGDDGYVRDIKKFTATSDANGLAQATFVRGCVYRGRRGVRGDWVEFTVGDVSVFSLPEILGEE